MFSGIIRTLGEVVEAKHSDQGVSLKVQSDLFAQNKANLGDSICVNGVCLTIAEIAGVEARFFIVNESLRRSNLSKLEIGDKLHLEPSLRVGDTIDGHFVYGHVDATVELSSIEKDGESYRFTFLAEEETLMFLAPKGSVALEGVSLTVGELGANNFSVYIVPHTYSVTLFSKFKVGEKINLEIDPMARYLVNYLNRKESQKG